MSCLRTTQTYLIYFHVWHRNAFNSHIYKAENVCKNKNKKEIVADKLSVNQLIVEALLKLHDLSKLILTLRGWPGRAS